MNIYLIKQDENSGYDTYDSAVVAFESEDEARNFNPGGAWKQPFSTWASAPEKVTVKLIGIAAEGIEKGLILASFNAG